MNQTYDRYLLPWEICAVGCRRKDLYGAAHATVFPYVDKYNYCINNDNYFRELTYYLIEDAMTNCDRELLFYGYEFIDVVKVEKLKLLL